MKINSTVVLNSDEKTLFKDIAESENQDGAINKILRKKLGLSDQKKTKSRDYLILSLLERVIEDIELWREKEDEQEITFYRRAASLLDVLFKGTDIMLVEYV